MKHTMNKSELATKSIELAQTIPDKEKRDVCIASVVAFGSKYLNDSEKRKLLEVLKMADLATMIFEDGLAQGKIETAKSMLKDNLNIATIVKYTNLDESTIEQLKEEL